jgi:hypothetical protein
MSIIKKRPYESNESSNEGKEYKIKTKISFDFCCFFFRAITKTNIN